MNKTILRVIKDIGECVESAAHDYTGEMKGELFNLVCNIKEGRAGYSHPLLTELLPSLENGLNLLRRSNKSAAVSELGRLSRILWSRII